jgi:pyruvate formate-lyase activating enzyme-like uncharacterized protein
MIFNDNYSQGCKLCQEGKWLCIFLTHLCDAECKFCPSFYKDDRIHSTFGNDLSEILSHIKTQEYSGISFSGGDPFKVFDRMLEWLTEFKTELPDYYYWAYSNGLNLDENKMRIIAQNGLREIRFNIAALKYNSAGILKTIEMSKKYIEFVAVEIPSIPDDYNKLSQVLPILDSIGVDYLNLHEYILVPSLHKQNLQQSATFRLNHEVDINYHTKSQLNTEQIIKFCHEKNLKIKINNCSLLKKEHQMKMRRLSMGRIMRNSFEKLTDEGHLVCYACIPGSADEKDLKNYFDNKSLEFLDYLLINESEAGLCLVNEKKTLVRLTFLPPLELTGKRKLISTEIITALSS